jgi:hypothetical protein
MVARTRSRFTYIAFIVASAAMEHRGRWVCIVTKNSLLTPRSRVLLKKLTVNFAASQEIFNYLGSILNAGNKMNIEIAERITKGSKAYYLLT